MNDLSQEFMDDIQLKIGVVINLNLLRINKQNFAFIKSKNWMIITKIKKKNYNDNDPPMSMSN